MTEPVTIKTIKMITAKKAAVTVARARSFNFMMINSCIGPDSISDCSFQTGPAGRLVKDGPQASFLREPVRSRKRLGSISSGA